MGEARRKKLLGNTEPSNPNWKRRRKWTRRDEAQLQQEVMRKLLGIIPRGYR